MANRMFRDDMMDSQRVLSLPIEGRWLYVAILFSADDLGLFEASSFKLSRKADLRCELVDRLLPVLADVDLIRLYTVQARPLGFVPRFRQRLQIKRAKFPLPPLALLAGDEDAASKINDLGVKSTVGQQCIADGQRQSTVVQPSEPEPEPEVKEESSTPTGLQTLVVAAGAATTRYRVPNCPNDEIVALYHTHLPALPAVEVMNSGRKRALSARWREVCADGKFDRKDGLEWFVWFFARVAASDFLMGKQPGRSGRTWAADFDFLMTPTKFARVVEGRYLQQGATA